MGTRQRIAQLQEEILATAGDRSVKVESHKIDTSTPAVKIQALRGPRAAVFAAANPMIKWFSWRLLAYITVDSSTVVVQLIRREYYEEGYRPQ